MLIALVVFLAYFITAKFGLTLNPVSGFATLVWLPSGISLASILLYGYKLAPAIFLGAFLANFSSGASILVALGIASGNTLEAIVGAFLLKKLINFNPSLDRLKDVYGLIFLAGIFATTISATTGVLSLYLGQVVSYEQLLFTWVTWWVGDMVSILVITPFLLIWNKKFMFNKKRFIEVVLLTIFLLASGFLVFSSFVAVSPKDHPISYLVFPPLIWAAIRFGQKGATAATLTLSIIAISTTASGFGPFNKGTFTENLIFLQLFMAISSITGLILGAFTSERERLEVRKDEFISVASHELKTPLTTIQGYSQILEDLLKNTRNKAVLIYLRKQAEQISRINKLVTDLLDVSKIQSGSLELNREKFKLSELIREVIEDIQLTTSHELIMEGDSRINVWADRDRIREVLINLINNAVKYSPRAKKVLIHTFDGRDLIRISIQDFGIGIARPHLESIFERFYQAETRIRQSFQGLGLGLYISSAIIRNHGGEIRVDSTKGRGSTFTVVLPKGKSA